MAKTLSGHSSTVWSVAFGSLSDGTLVLATASADRTAQLWNPETGEHLHTLSGHTNIVNSVAFGTLTDGTTLLATACDDTTARIWNPATGEHIHTLARHAGRVWSVAFGTLPNGTTILATASNDHTVGLWDPATGQLLRTLAGHTRVVYSAAFGSLPDGTTLLASASDDNTARVWNAATGQQLHVLTGHTSFVYSVAFGTQPDGTLILATASSDSTVQLWDPATGQHLRTLIDHAQSVWSVTFANQPDGTLILATGGYDHTARLWDAATGKHLYKMDHPEVARGIAFAPGRATLAVGCADSLAYLWDLGGIEPVPAVNGQDVRVVQERTLDLPGHTGTVYSVAFGTLPDGTALLATASDDNTTRLWHQATGQHLRTLTGHTDSVISAAFGALPDGTPLLATASGDTTIRLWNPTTGQRLRTFTGHTAAVNSVAFGALPDGTPILATASDDYTARVWNATTGNHLHTLTGHNSTVWSVAFGTLPDGTPLVATACNDHTAQLWNATTGQHMYTLGHTDAVWSVAFGKLDDGTPLLATAGRDRQPRLWNPVTGEILQTLTGHDNSVYSVTFGDLLLATASNDNTIRLWNPATGVCLQTIAASLGSGRNISEITVTPVNHRTLVIASTPADEPKLTLTTVEMEAAGPVAPRHVRRAATAGLITLAASGIHPPLQLLDDLVDLTAREQPVPEGLAALADHPGVEALRALAWPPASRIGLAALLIADLVFDSRFTAPDANPSVLWAALRRALHAAGVSNVEPAPVGALLTAANTITPQVVTLLTLLGPDAVALDPALPLRLRDQASLLPKLDSALLRRTELEASRQMRHAVDSFASTVQHHYGSDGVSRKGRLVNLLPTQLALPKDVFTFRYAFADILYRLNRSEAPPELRPAVVVLDTSPATFGPVEKVLRLVAHCLAVVHQQAGQPIWLVTMDEPDRSTLLSTPRMLLKVWSDRTLRPPDLGAALQSAHRTPAVVTILLAEHHLVRQYAVRAHGELRVLSCQATADSKRSMDGPWQLSLGPGAGPVAIAAAVAKLVQPIR